MSIKKPLHVIVEGTPYNAESVARFGSFKAFKKDADEQTEANETAHFGQWDPEAREANLQRVWDESTAAIEAAKPADAIIDEG